MHVVSPAWQFACVPVAVLWHERPEQQAIPPTVQCWLESTHVAALTQVPEVPQVSPSQQVTDPPQAWFRSEQLLAADWQVPAVAPGGMLQESPKQQSAETVQLWFCCWQ